MAIKVKINFDEPIIGEDHVLETGNGDLYDVLCLRITH